MWAKVTAISAKSVSFYSMGVTEEWVIPFIRWKLEEDETYHIKMLSLLFLLVALTPLLQYERFGTHKVWQTLTTVDQTLCEHIYSPITQQYTLNMFSHEWEMAYNLILGPRIQRISGYCETIHHSLS